MLLKNKTYWSIILFLNLSLSNASAQDNFLKCVKNFSICSNIEDQRKNFSADDEDKIIKSKSTQNIKIQATTSVPDVHGEFTINILTSFDTSSLLLDGDEQGASKDGKYSIKRVARVSEDNIYKITARDIYGNVGVATVSVRRQTVSAVRSSSKLNPEKLKINSFNDSVAIIVGIENYKNLPKADFANGDAKDFYTYATRALGIKPENIKLLLDEEAGDLEIYRAFQNWLPLKVKKGKTDLFVFYSGHGLPSQDGKSLYFLPWSTDKDFIDKTAIKQQEIIASIESLNPRSTTIFIDSCYSGQAKSSQPLLEGIKPIYLKSTENSYPKNFTVISASAPDQLSSANSELKHGIFSFYLMKGMEGDADLNNDGKTTVAEMHEYLIDTVGREAMGMNRKQQPQLYGDTNKILITK